MTNMMLEVNDELRHNQIKALWDKYGVFILGGAAAIILGTAIGTVWHSHVNNVLAAQTEAFYTAVQEDSKDQQKLAARLADIAKDAPAPLQSMILLHRGLALESLKDFDAARQNYLDVAQKNSRNKMVRDLALVNAVRTGMQKNEKPEILLNDIAPATEKDGAFRGSALEFKALLLSQQGKTKEANEIFILLSKDDSVPDTLRARAKTLIRYEGK